MFSAGSLVCRRNKNIKSDIKDDLRIIFFLIPYKIKKMVKTLSSFRPSIANNGWIFSVTCESKKDLEESLSKFKEVHSSKITNPRIIEDPDVIGFYTLGGTCKSKGDAELAILFIENTLHQDDRIDDVYDWPGSND